MSYRAGPTDARFAQTPGGNVTVTSTTFVDVYTFTSITVRRKQLVLIEVCVGITGNGTEDNSEWQLVDEANTVLATGRDSSSTAYGGLCSAFAVQEVAAGTTKTYKLQAKVLTAGHSALYANSPMGGPNLIAWTTDT